MSKGCMSLTSGIIRGCKEKSNSTKNIYITSDESSIIYDKDKKIIKNININKIHKINNFDNFYHEYNIEVNNYQMLYTHIFELNANDEFLKQCIEFDKELIFIIECNNSFYLYGIDSCHFNYNIKNRLWECKSIYDYILISDENIILKLNML